MKEARSAGGSCHVQTKLGLARLLGAFFTLVLNSSAHLRLASPCPGTSTGLTAFTQTAFAEELADYRATEHEQSQGNEATSSLVWTLTLLEQTLR